MRTIAVEGLTPQSNRSDRQLSSATLWDRYLYHGSVRSYIDRVWITRLMALPVNDTEEGYDNPDRVRWSLAQDDVKSYQEAAEFLNFNNIDMVCLRHEYGIFGGPAGSHILHLLRGSKMPLGAEKVLPTVPSRLLIFIVFNNLGRLLFVQR